MSITIGLPSAPTIWTGELCPPAFWLGIGISAVLIAVIKPIIPCVWAIKSGCACGGVPKAFACICAFTSGANSPNPLCSAISGIRTLLARFASRSSILPCNSSASAFAFNTLTFIIGLSAGTPKTASCSL